MKRTRSTPWLLVFTILLAAFGAAVPIDGQSPAGAQVSGNTGYTPCEAGQDVDLLIMMDASGSLNAPASGIDPNGAQRREALQRFRNNLTGLLSELPERDAAEVRIALWRFDRDVIQIASFAEPSFSHPADDEIELSLGDPLSNDQFAFRGRYTDYLTALRAAVQAFQAGSDADACRLLLFFTDGVYDPTGDPTLAQADQLRSEVCGVIKGDFERAGIDTYSILLGDHFGSAGATTPDADAEETESDEIRQEMATASMQVMRALTGDADSHLVRDVPYGGRFGCREWSDEQPSDRDGAIVQIGDLEQLALQLLEVAEVAARGLVEWTNCGVLPGLGAQSAPMPAGWFIDTIVAYPRDSAISGYEIATAAGTTRRGDGSGAEPLRLGGDELGDLEAGWTIEFTTTGGSGGIDVACYVKQNQEPLDPVDGRVTDTEGAPLDAVRRSPAGPDSPPFGVRVTADAPPGLCDADRTTVVVDPEYQRVLDWYCSPDGRNAVFDLTSLECGEQHHLTAPLRLSYEPRHSDALFSSAERVVATEVVLDGPPSVLYDCLGAPVLACAADAAESAPQPGQDEPATGVAVTAAQAPGGLWPMTVEPDSDEVPREPLRGASPCVLQPPTRGAAHVEARWHPDGGAALPGDIQWRFDSEFHSDTLTGTLNESGTVLTLDVAADPSGVTLHFTTTDELDNGEWAIVGYIELTPSWDPGADDSAMLAGAAAQMSDQRAALWVDQDYLARSNSALAFWLTLLLLLLSIVLSYLLFCLALVRSMSLPDPSAFWLYHVRAPLSEDGRGQLSLGPQAQAAITSASAQRIIGTSGRGGKRVSEWRAEGLTMRLRRSPRLWLFGLLRGPWSSITAEGSNAIGAQPVARRKSHESGTAFAAADFNVLEVLGSSERSPDGGQVAPIWIARPKHGPLASTETTDMRALDELMRRVPAEDQTFRSADDAGGRAPDEAPQAEPPSPGPARQRPEGSRERAPDAPPRSEPRDRPPPPREPRDRPPPRREPRDRPPPREPR